MEHSLEARSQRHASNCVCYLLERERLLFTGDHVLEGVAHLIKLAREHRAGERDGLWRLTRP